jgi:hypothetical protein
MEKLNYLARNKIASPIESAPPIGMARSRREGGPHISDEISPQIKLDYSFDNYFSLAEILKADIQALLDEERRDQYWRRNFIRSSGPFFEGYAHCLRDMCRVRLDCSPAPYLTEKESRVLQSERGFGAPDRIEVTLNMAYRFFELALASNFDCKGWQYAKKLFTKRNGLMHPKNPTDLEVTDDVWSEIHEGVTWLMEQFFSFYYLLHQKYLSRPS